MANTSQIPLSLPEQLTRQFYNWEKGGRGWTLWSEPVELEPPFNPFLGHYGTAPPTTYDDGRRSTFLSSLFRNKRSEQPTIPAPEEDCQREPLLFEDHAEVATIQIALPHDAKITKDALSALNRSIGFTPLKTTSSCTWEPYVICYR